MNINSTSINQDSSVATSSIATVCNRNHTTTRQHQLESYWQSKGGDLSVFQQLLPLFDVVEQSADGAIDQTGFEARLDELQIIGIGKYLPTHKKQPYPVEF